MIYGRMVNRNPHAVSVMLYGIEAGLHPLAVKIESGKWTALYPLTAHAIAVLVNQGAAPQLVSRGDGTSFLVIEIDA